MKAIISSAQTELDDKRKTTLLFQQLLAKKNKEIELLKAQLQKEKSNLKAARLKEKKISSNGQQALLQKKIEIFRRTSRLSRIGGWDVDLINNKVTFTAVTREIHEIDESYNLTIETAINFCKPGVSRNRVANIIQKALKTKMQYAAELQIITAKGNLRWVRTVGESVFANGKCIRLYGTLQDITTEKIKDIQSTQNEQLFRQTLTHAPIGIALVSPEGNWIKVNKSLCNIVGYTEQELLQINFQKITHTSDLDEDLHYVQALLNDEIENYQLEKRYIHKNGEIIWVLISVSLVKDNASQPLYFISHVMNITQRKKNEQVIKEDKELLRMLIDNIPVNIFIKDLQSRKKLVNKKEVEYSGFKDEKEILGKDDFELYPAESATVSREEDLYVFGTGVPIIDKETINIKHDGSKHWFLTSKIPLRNEQNKITGLLGISYGIDERKNAEDALRLAEQQSKSTANKISNLIASMSDGILVADEKQNIVLTNKKFCEMFSLAAKPEELAGMPCMVINEKNKLLFKNPDKFIADTEEVFNNRQPFVQEMLELKDGRIFRREYVPLLADSEYAGYFWRYTNITPQKILEQHLRIAKQEAEQSAQAKEIFLANMSHEIRTPINAILGITRQLQKTKIDNQQHFYLTAVNSAATNLLVILNDVLDLSKIQSGKLVLEEIGFSFSDVVNKAIHVMLHKAEEKGLEVSLNIDATITKILIGDKHRINQILLNLLGNAIKFTATGSIAVSCTVLKNTAEEQIINLQVKDTGIGISEEYLKNIFQEFSQENESIGRRFGGTGLGMSIIKQLVEVMHGEIKIESSKGSGTAVDIQIPFRKGTIKDLPKAEEIHTDANVLKDKKILLVEDNELNRMVAQMVLSQYGAVIDEATDGAAAIARLKQNNYDLVLMDVRMPVLDGVKATAFIRKDVNQKIPIIALTANVVNGEQQKCLAAGMNDFLVKPFEEEQLIRVVTKWLGIETKKSAQYITDVISKEQLFSLNKLEKISRGNHEFVTKMLNIFVRETANAIDEIKNAYNDKELKKLQSIVHRIKPSIENLQITSLKEDTVYIENVSSFELENKEIAHLVSKMEKVLTAVLKQIEEILLVKA